MARWPAGPARSVRRRQPADLLVVGDDAVAADVGMVVAIDHHEADAEGVSCCSRSVLPDAVRRPSTMPSTCRWRSISSSWRSLAGILVRAAEEQAVAARARHRFEAGDDLDEERVHQIGDDDAEGVRAAEGQAARDRVGLVAELGDFGETRARVACPMSSRLFSTLETVVIDTPSSPAMRFMVVGGIASL